MQYKHSLLQNNCACVTNTRTRLSTMTHTTQIRASRFRINFPCHQLRNIQHTTHPIYTFAYIFQTKTNPTTSSPSHFHRARTTNSVPIWLSNSLHLASTMLDIHLWWPTLSLSPPTRLMLPEISPDVRTHFECSRIYDEDPWVWGGDILSSFSFSLRLGWRELVVKSKSDCSSFGTRK